MYVFVYLRKCLVACYSVANLFVRSELVTEDPDLIQIRACCGLDTRAIWRLTYGMIRKIHTSSFSAD